MSFSSLYASVILLSGFHALADSSVEDRLRNKIQDHRGGAVRVADWRGLAVSLLDRAPAAPACANVHQKRVVTYVYTTDADNRPCRVYDLAFPTLQTLTAAPNVAVLPTQPLRARDYLSWLEGDYDQVLRGMQNFRNDPQAPMADWVHGLRFKNANVLSQRVAGTNLPLAFRASDLDIGNTFQWKANDRALIARLIQAGRADQWQAILENPESLLQKIKFNWNDLEKVYEIAIEGQFLPIAGPIALVDFNQPYKLAVEALVRSLVHSALSELTKGIPKPAGSVIAIAINDGFEFAEMAYSYQMNRMEETLMHEVELDPAINERASNILAGGRADFVGEYMKSVITKKPFDWAVFEDIGRKLRYDASRRRDIKMSELNSRMVLDQGCSMTLVRDYFGICAKGGKERMHSMISEVSVLFWNLGAPLVFDRETPAQVTLRRGTAYLLSVGSRLVELPYLGGLMGKLTQICKELAFTGITDEGFLRGSLEMVSEQDETLSKWLYIQNLDAFLAKTKAQEAAIIDANAALLNH